MNELKKKLNQIQNNLNVIDANLTIQQNKIYDIIHLLSKFINQKPSDNLINQGLKCEICEETYSNGNFICEKCHDFVENIFIKY